MQKPTVWPHCHYLRPRPINFRPWKSPTRFSGRVYNRKKKFRPKIFDPAENDQFWSKKFFWHIYTQNDRKNTLIPNICLKFEKNPFLGPKMAKNGPKWASRPKWAQKDLAIFRPPGGKKSKKNFLLKITFKPSPKGLGALKTQNWPSGPPQRPIFGPFCDHFGPFGTQKTRFFRKKIFCSKSLLNHPRGVWDP